MGDEPHWYVLINPAEYDDDEDKGFATSVQALTSEEAVELAIQECEAGNGWEPGYIDRDNVQEWDVHLDGPKNLVEAVNAYDGTDFATLRAMIFQHLDGHP